MNSNYREYSKKLVPTSHGSICLHSCKVKEVWKLCSPQALLCMFWFGLCPKMGFHKSEQQKKRGWDGSPLPRQQKQGGGEGERMAEFPEFFRSGVSLHGRLWGNVAMLLFISTFQPSEWRASISSPHSSDLEYLALRLFPWACSGSLLSTPH